MSVAIEHTGANSVDGSNTLVLPELGTGASDRIAVVLGTGGSISGHPTITSVVRAGQTFSAQEYATRGLYIFCHCALYVTPSEAAAITTITYQYSGQYGAGIHFLSGVDTAAPNRDSGTANGNASNSSIGVTSAVGDLVCDSIGGFGDMEGNAGSGQTEWWYYYIDPAMVQWHTAGSTKAGASGTVNMTWTWSGTQEWMGVAISVAFKAGAGGDELPQSLHAVRQGVIGSPCQLHPIEEGYVS